MDKTRRLLENRTLQIIFQQDAALFTGRRVRLGVLLPLSNADAHRSGNIHSMQSASTVNDQCSCSLFGSNKKRRL